MTQRENMGNIPADVRGVGGGVEGKADGAEARESVRCADTADGRCGTG